MQMVRGRTGVGQNGSGRVSTYIFLESQTPDQGSQPPPHGPFLGGAILCNSRRCLWPPSPRCQEHHAPSAGTAPNASPWPSAPEGSGGTHCSWASVDNHSLCITTRSSPHLSPLGLSPRVLGFPSVLGLVLSPEIVSLSYLSGQRRSRATRAQQWFNKALGC